MHQEHETRQAANLSKDKMTNRRHMGQHPQTPPALTLSIFKGRKGVLLGSCVLLYIHGTEEGSNCQTIHKITPVIPQTPVKALPNISYLSAGKIKNMTRGLSIQKKGQTARGSMKLPLKSH